MSILADAGLQADFRFPDSLPSITHEHVYQHNQTDLEFLRRLASRKGFWWVSDTGADGTAYRFGDSTLPPVLLRLDLRNSGHGPTRPGTVGVSSIQIGKSTSPAKVVVRGWDPVKKRAIVAEASDPNGTGVDDTSGVAASNEAEMSEIAQVRLEQAQTAAQIFSGTSNASSLSAGQTNNLKGVGEGLDGEFYVTRVRHQLVTVETPTGTTLVYGNQFRGKPRSTVRPHLDVTKNAARIAGTSTAIVESSPDQLGRIKVKLPWGDDSSSNWIRVAQNHTSRSGSFFIPEIGDEVLVGFEHGDPDRPIIVGRLWNEKDRPPFKR